MTFRSLAFSNIRGKWRSYSAFFLSSVFSVMIFYIYAAFLAHPDVVNGNIIAADKVRLGMIFCEYVIFIFSFLFVLYSNSAFLKTRKQEFGLFSLFGMTRMQLRRLVIYENLTIAVLAISVGIGLGILFSKMFFIVLSMLLNMSDTITFFVPLQAVGLTMGSFLVLFTLISFWSVLGIGRTEIIELLKASKKTKGELFYSPWLVVLAIVSLLVGYTIALMLNGGNFGLLDMQEFSMLAIGIMVAVVIGTYLLYSQFSILLLRFIQKRYNVYYNRTNMMVIAQLGYKMKDNARMLFIVSILSAIIVTASGAFSILAASAQQEELKEMISLTMFIGLFISLLFFIAAGSMIYFKLFTELKEDQAQIKALIRIGITDGEIRKIVFTQVGIIFFLPCVVGIIHALVAMKALDNILMSSSWFYSFIVIGIYLVMQTIYFLIACRSYMGSMLPKRI
ncbi:ABC transporter permease [Bacillus thuringiensis]|uniref:FtsX-like permease family protein n=1 Tax=Bacillus cereus group TaxID=86661 RepID=UPI000BF255B4|nr:MULTISPECIES: FtsX-like permease family protein [Bacillus cereus group]MBE5096680.1 FtsX-like permease family protein [Bacillus thuringiensis]MEB9613529.1 FtsX-like permease family protein [Bacillus cereus]PFN81838.1 ABC transporter permease [Bacillus thuringiensis]PFO63149.1 ABC transporter permease [Bacillus cereus]PGW93433.1 ABC transporter permease [Bacillus cereus]